MGQIVVLAEKPSVGRDIARVLGCSTRGEGCLTGGGWCVTWAVGHLVTLQEPDEMDSQYKKWQFSTLPILPEDIPLKVIPQSKDQYKIVSRLLNAPETDSVICATDAGREGELIFRYIYRMCGCTKPFRRLWINSMTDDAIRDGFQALRPGADYDGLYESARCRSEADWLVGMNASRAFTLRYDALLSVGRVQTPTLAILVRRRREIEQFKPEGFATLTANFGDYSGVWFSPRLDPDTHLKDRAAAEAIAAQVKGKPAVVTAAETTAKRELPPQLYDLTSLQRDANRLLGFTAEKTLKIAQSLYEKRKALTYPRTDSRYLPPDMIPRVVQTMRLLPPSYQPLVPAALPGGKLPVSPRTVDASKVTDHHALIPTANRVNPDTFDPDERQLYDLVARRMLAAFYPACEYDATRVITEAEGHTFRSTGRVVRVNGWHDVPPLANPPKTRKKKADEEAPLPPLAVGDTRTVKGTQVKEDMTKPPAQMNDASLLSAMENAGKEAEDEEIVRQMKGSGIGTPATRAAIIERLIQVGYAERKGKFLTATDKGVRLIDVVPEELSSAETTGRWELALDRITRGEQDAAKFMDSIRKFSTFLVSYARDNSKPAVFPEEVRRGRGAKLSAKKLPDSVCPVCGKGKVLESPRAFSCDQQKKGCRFTLWKDVLEKGGGPALTPKLAQLVLRERTVRGSTGTIVLNERQIAFYPNGQDWPSVSRSLLWEKRAPVQPAADPIPPEKPDETIHAGADESTP